MEMKQNKKEGMLKDFLIKFGKESQAVNPSGLDMFKEDNSKKLNENEKMIFHKTVAKTLFLCKRAQPIMCSQ